MYLMTVGAPDKDEKLKSAACFGWPSRPMRLALFGRPAEPHDTVRRMRWNRRRLLQEQQSQRTTLLAVPSRKVDWADGT